MIIDPKLYPRILALPLAFRRLLAETEGPGLLVHARKAYPAEGYPYNVEPFAGIPCGCEFRVSRGDAWLPSDPTAWLRCACEYVRARWWVVKEDGCGIYYDDHGERDTFIVDPVSLVCQVIEEYEKGKSLDIPHDPTPIIVENDAFDRVVLGKEEK